MAFFVYDQQTRTKFDSATQKQLDRLAEKYQAVEIKEIVASSEWCVRIVVAADGNADERLRLASLGDTAYTAAIRLSRMVQFEEGPADEGSAETGLDDTAASSQ